MTIDLLSIDPTRGIGVSVGVDLQLATWRAFGRDDVVVMPLHWWPIQTGWALKGARRIRLDTVVGLQVGLQRIAALVNLGHEGAMLLDGPSFYRATREGPIVGCEAVLRTAQAGGHRHYTFVAAGDPERRHVLPGILELQALPRELQPAGLVALALCALDGARTLP